MLNFVIQILTALLFILKLKIFADDVEKEFDTSNYECNRPLAMEKNKKVIGLMQDEL